MGYLLFEETGGRRQRAITRITVDLSPYLPTPYTLFPATTL
jgi:hypothetical protein